MAERKEQGRRLQSLLSVIDDALVYEGPLYRLKARHSKRQSIL